MSKSDVAGRLNGESSKRGLRTEKIMTQYQLANLTPAGQSIDPARLETIIRDVTALTRDMQDAGVWVFAMPLADPSAGVVARHRDGEIVFDDGPFAETKEYIGGVTVIDVPDLGAARHWAERTAVATGLDIEVRPAPSWG